MTKSERRFLLELSLNLIFLGIGLSIAFFLLLSAQKSHQETLALSKIQAEMMTISEAIRAHETPDSLVLNFDSKGHEVNTESQYRLTLSPITQEGFTLYHLQLTQDTHVISEWDVGVSP